MFARIRIVWLVLCAAAWSCTLAAPLAAQCPAKTTVSDTLYNADGSLAAGRVTLAWPTFVIGSCQVIAGQTSVTVANGAFSAQLYPNTSAVPAGTSYRVTFALKSGRVTTEYWVVPASAVPVPLATVRAPSVPVPAVMFGEAQITNLVSDLAKKIELASPCVSGKILESNGSSTPPQVNCVDPLSGSGSQHQVNSVNLASNSPINFQNSPSVAFVNPGVGNLQASIADGAVTAAKLAVSSPSAAQLAGIGDSNIAAAALSPNRVVGTAVTQSRAISTTSPITGGGDFSTDRTIACPTCVTSVSGTAEEITVTGTAPPVVSIPAVLNLSGKTLKGASPLVFEGLTADAFETTVVVTDPTAARSFTLPNADSVAVQPLTCAGTDKVSAISALGVISCTADQGGAGSGDNITVDGVAATDANFLSGARISASLNTAPSPDEITLDIVANSLGPTQIDETLNFAWTGTHSFNLGATPANAVLLDIAQPGVAGTRNSHWIQLRGTSFDTAGHNADWLEQVIPTSNAGASRWSWQSRIDAGAFTERATLTDAGAFDVAAGFRIAGAATLGRYLRGDGSIFGISTVAAGGAGTCTNQFVRATLDNAAPTCATVTSADTSGTFPASAHNLLSATHGDSLAASPVLGDVVHGNATPAWARLAGNITTTKQYLSQTGTGAVSAVPAWAQVAFADISGAITDAQAPDDLAITVTGTAEEITVTGTDPPVLSIPAVLNLGGKTLKGGSPLVFEGLTADAFETTVVVTDPSAARSFTLPNADSVAVQPDTGAANNFLTAISALGVISKAQPAFSNLSGTATIAQGGTGTGATLTGLLRGSASAFTAAELSGAVSTSGSNATTLATKYVTGMKDVTIDAPTTADSNKVQWYFAQAITITRVACAVGAATSISMQLDERAEATPNTAGTNVLTAALDCTTTTGATTSFTNATIAARVPLNLQITAVTGTPGSARIHIEYTVD